MNPEILFRQKSTITAVDERRFPRQSTEACDHLQ
jgi:hypothetical protein